MEHNNQNKNLLKGEIIFETQIEVDDDGRIQNKSELQKCLCCQVEAEYHGGSSNWKSGKVKIPFSCSFCKKRWTVKFKNPFLKMYHNDTWK